MKKGLILLLCLLLLLPLALSGCSEPKDTETDAGTAAGTEAGDSASADTGKDPADAVLPGTLLAAAEAVFEELPPSVVYDSAEKPADPTVLVNMFSGNMEFDEDYNILPPAEFAEGGAVAAYAIHTPSGKNAVEIVILLAKDAGSLDAARALCQYRLDWMLSDKNDVVLYDSTASAILEAAEIYVKGNYVMLLATPDNGAVKAVIDPLLA